MLPLDDGAFDVFFPAKPLNNGLHLLKIGVDDEWSDHITNDNDSKKMENDEKESDLLWPRRVFETDFKLRPIIDNQEIEQNVHSTEHVIEIVRPVIIVDEITSFQKDRGQRILWIPSNYCLEKKNSWWDNEVEGAK